MIWFLRIGIILQFLGAISLSTPLVFIFVGERTIKRWVEYIENKLSGFLNWFLNKVYGQVRVRKMSPDASKCERVKQNYIALGIILAIAVCGFIALFAAVATHNVIAIIVSVPFAIFSGWVFSKAFDNRVLKVMVFIFFAVTSVFIYAMLILSALFHVLLLSIISCIALFHSMLAWLAQRRVKRVMLISGGLLLAIGMTLQFASTFL